MYCFILILLISSAVPLSCSSETVKYGIGEWKEDGYGNHRAVLRVKQHADAVRAHIEWRRRDHNPETKAIIIEDAATGTKITNVFPANIQRECADIVFQPQTIPGDYYVYYLPYKKPTSSYDVSGDYFKPDYNPDPLWIQRNSIAGNGWKNLPTAELIEIQARTEFDSFYPMEVPATQQELRAFLSKHKNDEYLIFTEDRKFPAKMKDELPLKWIKSGPSSVFSGAAQLNEFYAFQIALYAHKKPLKGISVSFSDLKNGKGAVIPKKSITCINTSGVDWLGRHFIKDVQVEKGAIQPLWIGIQIPKDASGSYKGLIKISGNGISERTVEVRIEVSGEVLADKGDSELWRMSRLRWLNSTKGLDDEVIPPFTPLQKKGSAISCLGRTVVFNSIGLPERIISNGRQVLSSSIRLKVYTPEGAINWKSLASRTIKNKPGTITELTRSSGKNLDLTITRKMEADGCISFQADLVAKKALELKDIRLQVPISKSAARYMMGMSKRGGKRPSQWKWKWDKNRCDNLVWIGDYDAGLQVKLCPENEEWETDFHRTGIPESWHNGGKGGCNISESSGSVLVDAFTGSRKLKAQEKLSLKFRLIVTPVKPIDPQRWSWRNGNHELGGNIIHVHHGVWENPYINYPFIYPDRLKSLVDKAQNQVVKAEKGMLKYPAKGLFNPAKGSIHAWVTIGFDPTVGEPGQGQFNNEFLSIQDLRRNSLNLYWNIDDRGMRYFEMEKGSIKNLFGSTSSDWRAGQEHLISLSWGDEIAIYVDGRKLQSIQAKGAGAAINTETAFITFGGPFILHAVKINKEPFSENFLAQSPDKDTILFETFDSSNGKVNTKGFLSGMYEAKNGSLIFKNVERSSPSGINLYYTVREISNHIVEMWPFRSLGDEIFRTTPNLTSMGESSNDNSGGYAWLKEHLVSGYVPAWLTDTANGDIDAAIITQGLCRFHNYYIEGLDWLMRYTGFNGLYLDGIGYDREVMKRVAKIMHRANPDYRIEFHGGNTYDFLDLRLSPANNWLEHFPYVKNLWFGEFFDYNRDPDYWLVEISGIPFGLMNEMLDYRTGGNPYRGMIYGMTGRFHPSMPSMWKLWDNFGIETAEMIGYWDRRCPVKTDNPSVLATVYKKDGKTLIALADWTNCITEHNEQQDRQKATVQITSKSPTIDGKVENSEWAHAAQLAGFWIIGSRDRAKYQTVCWVTADNQMLYMAFRCYADTNNLKADASHGGNVWEDDAIEIFIQPNLNISDYFQFVGNSAGAYYDGKNMGGAWQGNWEYKTSVKDGYWEGELSIPLKDLGIKALKEGAKIGFNVGRDQPGTPREISAWSPVSSNFHEPKSFGVLTFSESKPSTRQIKPQDESKPQTFSFRLKIDWQALGLDPAKTKLTAPRVDYFQEAAVFDPKEAIKIERSKGILLIAEENQ